MEVDIFSPASGQLLDSWVFRTALDQEQRLLLQQDHRPRPWEAGAGAAGGGVTSEHLAEEVGRLADRIDELAALVGAALLRRNAQVTEFVAAALQSQQGQGAQEGGAVTQQQGQQWWQQEVQEAAAVTQGQGQMEALTGGTDEHSVAGGERRLQAGQGAQGAPGYRPQLASCSTEGSSMDSDVEGSRDEEGSAAQGAGRGGSGSVSSGSMDGASGLGDGGAGAVERPGQSQ